jgi:hypothetical protein
MLAVREEYGLFDKIIYEIDKKYREREIPRNSLTILASGFIKRGSNNTFSSLLQYVFKLSKGCKIIDPQTPWSATGLDYFSWTESMPLNERI